MTDDDLQAKIADLKAQIAQRDSQIDSLENWRDKLEKWRKAIVDEYLAMSDKPIRDPKMQGVKLNLELCIHTIDRGTGYLADSGYDLTNLRLGELMRADGFVPIGADPDRNYAGEMPWIGSLRETDRNIKHLRQHRDVLQSQLDDALLTPEQRAKRDAEAEARVAELNARPTRKRRGDGSEYLKFADGRRVEVT